MSGFGEKMRREREMRGVSLEEISESTKIGTRSLRALDIDASRANATATPALRVAQSAEIPPARLKQLLVADV